MKQTVINISTKTNNIHSKRFPPYGRRLDAIRRRGLAPRVRIVVATDWEIGKLFPRVIVTPDQAVHNLRFEYLAGLHVQIAHFDHDHHINDLIAEIISVQPVTLTTCNLDAAKQCKIAFNLIYSHLELEAA